MKKKALLRPGNHALADDTTAEEIALGACLILHKLPFPSKRLSST